ncbi:Leukotriene C4 synthase, partial [Calypte anna]
AYFVLQVICAQQKYKISPPETRGHPEFEWIFRAQANCSRHFPILISSGLLESSSIKCGGCCYLYTLFRYFQGYVVAAQGWLGPLCASAWLLEGLARAGFLAHFLMPQFLP